ncbi:MAG: DUF1684 domain-containing protein [Chitinophagaceae bacterium]|nr:DUF1684 domain-containing protein [Chitinophagaceae bacterium]
MNTMNTSKGIFNIYKLSLLLFSLSGFSVVAQTGNYNKYIQEYQQAYSKNHEVVKGDDKKNIRFFPADESFRIQSSFERIYEAPWFKMETSGKEKKIYRDYGILRFTIKDTSLKLHIYQSQHLMSVKEYSNHLFIPFTDLSNGEESYENGRYIDLVIADVENGKYVIDFNKAYNPYCAYINNVYNCPVPPKENNLNVAIKAGEMKYGKKY